MSSIRNRVLLVLLAAGLVPLLLILFVSQTLTRKAIEESQFDQMAGFTEEVGRNVTVFLDNSNKNLQSLTTNRIIQRQFVEDSSWTPEERESEREAFLEEKRVEFTRVAGAYTQFFDISLYDRSGRYVASTSKPKIVNLGYEKGDMFEHQSAVGGSPTISKPRVADSITLGDGPPKVEVVFSSPVEDDDEVPFVVHASLDFQQLWNSIDAAKMGDTGFFVLLDSSNNPIYHVDRSRVFDPEKFDNRYSSDHWLRNPRGVYSDLVYTAHKLSPYRHMVRGRSAKEQWVLIGFKKKEEADELIRENTDHMLLAALGTLLFAVVIGFWLSRRLSEQVIRVSKAARLVSKGKLGTRIPEIGPQEMKDLARDFNLMVGELRQHREGLEFLVQERTRNLRESQEQLSDLTAQLRASYDSTQEAILVVKTDGEVLTANRRFCELFDIDSAAALDSAKLEAQVEGCFLESERFGEHWRRCNDSLSFVDDDEWSVVSPREMVITIYSAPVKNASNVTFARLWMFRDLTEQRQLENGLRQAQKMEAVGRLAGGVAHDFNNLLTGIIGNLSLAQMNQKVHPEKMGHLVASAKHAGQRAAELVKQLLGFSRQSHLKLQRCKVNEIAEEVKDLLIHSIDPRIQIVLDLREDLWDVSADPNQLQQVIMNMAVNSKDAIGEVKGRIRIGSANLEIDEFHASLVNDANPEDYVRISVEDTGSGMSSEVKNKIFEPFFTTKEQGKGTGLGLATSYGIIQQHGGWISCESEEGVGTTFHIYIPRGDLKDFPEVMETKKKQVVGGSETVLLVDDEPVVRMVGEGVLKHHGYRVLLAGDGEEALSVIGEYGDEIGVIMLDLTMPKMSGRDTFKNLRAGDYPPIPVVVCSGYLVDLDEFADETGAKPEGFVQKPYDSEELARTLRSVLDGAAASTA
ncbi:MAG: ATP-binding protein [Verrucomicrobiales bacterium]|nr:ATP-binding protein [Verrucomicrobiales bacterium]MDF1789130.1 ATP-binding protein [Verrucomicrobiales bacterium]